MKLIHLFIYVCCLGLAPFALAQEEEDLGAAPQVSEGFLPEAGMMDREPAAIIPPSNKKRNYPGAADEEDLRVMAALPEAAIKTDSRSLQRDVYKQLYNQELKEETQNDLEE